MWFVNCVYFYHMSNKILHNMTNDLKTAAANYEAATHARNKAFAERLEWLENFRRTYNCYLTDDTLERHNQTAEWQRLTECKRVAMEKQKEAQRKLLFIASNGAATVMHNGRVK